MFGTLNASVPELPLPLIDCALREGVPFDWRVHALEKLVVNRVASAPRARIYAAWAGGGITDQRQVPVVLRSGSWVAARATQRADGQVIVGPSAGGGFMLLNPSPEALPPGPLATLAAAAASFADGELGTSIGDLVPPAVCEAGAHDA